MREFIQSWQRGDFLNELQKTVLIALRETDFHGKFEHVIFHLDTVNKLLRKLGVTKEANGF